MKRKKNGLVVSIFGLIIGIGILAGCKESEVGGSPAGSQPCPTPTGPTLHAASDITADQTWTAVGSPHLVTGRINIYDGATLTIESCAEVRLAPGIGIKVGSTGSSASAGTLRAVGTADKPIKFTRSDTAAWRNLWVNELGRIELAYVTLEGGGDDAFRYGPTLYASGDRLMPLKKLVKVDHVTIMQSAGVGFNFDNYSGFTDDSQQLVVIQSGMSLAYRAPGRITPQGASTLPSGSYTGNGVDEIVLPTSISNDVLQSATWKNLGVPYHIEGIPYSYVRVAADSNAGAAPVLTVEPGVKVKFDSLTALIIGVSAGGITSRGGVLKARGSDSQPIVFTSSAVTPAAGDWEGIIFRSMVPDVNEVDYARIEYAGGECLCVVGTCVPTGMGHEGAISMQAERPSKAFITNTVILKSALHGIVRAWNSDQAGPDFLPSNTFTDIAGCKQTLNRDDRNACPQNPPCP